MSFVDKEGEDGACGKATKGTAGKEAGMPYKGKSVGRRKETKESGRERSSMPYKEKGVARGVEKEFMEDIEEEG